MKSSEQIDRLIAEQSAEWTEILKAGDERDMAAFAQWSLKSPQHMRHFLMMTALDRELQHIDPQRRLEIPGAAGSTADSVVSLRMPSSADAGERPRLTRRWVVAAACAASLVLLFVVHLTVTRSNDWHDFSTVRGEQRAVELADGSIMHLNTQSHVEVRLSREARNVRMLSGEALFKVAKDSARPFRVHAADVTIQAVGTQFNVYAQSNGTKVSVLEGRVQISSNKATGTLSAKKPASLGAGQEARIDDQGKIATRELTDVAAIAAWRQRRLVFNQDPLSEVVTEFNRYNRAPRFRVVDPDVGLQRYSGAFDADDPESLVELLAVDSDLQLVTNGNEILIRRRTLNDALTP